MEQESKIGAAYPAGACLAGDVIQQGYATDGAARQNSAMVDRAPQFNGFDWALGVMKRGQPVKRDGWNGSGICVWMEKGIKEFRADESIPVLIDGIRREYFENGNGGIVTRAPNFVIRSQSGTNVRGWAPSQTDLMAEDWRFA